MKNASRVLQIRSSLSGDASVSNLLCDRLVSEFRNRGAEIEVRDLDLRPVPHVTSRTVAGVLRGNELVDDALETRSISDKIIDDVKWADCLAIAAPMYNFGVPSQLKAWFDHLMRPGATFEYVAGVPTGLLVDKRAIICSTRGNAYRGTSMKHLDCGEPHLHAMLEWVGITDITFITAEGLALGENARSMAIETALAEVLRLADIRQTD